LHADSAEASRSSAGERQDAERCDVTYGDVIDKAARKNISICRRAEQDGSGLSRVYVSQSNSLHIVFTPAASQQQRNFIIHLQGKQVSVVLVIDLPLAVCKHESVLAEFQILI